MKKKIKNNERVEIDIEDLQPFKQKLKTIRFKQKLVVNMELRSGRRKTFIVDSSKPSFNFNSGEFVIDQDLMIFNETYKLYELYYHECYSLPIMLSLPVNEVKKGFISGKAKEVISATNPITLYEYVRSNVIQSVIRANDFLKKLETYKLLWFITAIASVIHLLLYAQQIGLFAGIQKAIGG